MHFDTDIMMQHCRFFLANLMILHPHLYFIRVHHFLMMVLAHNIAIAVWPYFCTYFMGYLSMDHCERVIIQFVVIPEMVQLQNIRNIYYITYISLVIHQKWSLLYVTFVDTRKQDNGVCECIIKDESWIFTNGNLRLNCVLFAFAFDSTQINMKTNAEYN